MRRLAWLMSLGATMMLPLLSLAQARIDRLDTGKAGLAVAGPDFVSTWASVNDHNGNGDGLANPGEWPLITFSLHNSGQATAFDVHVSAFGDEPAIGSRPVAGSQGTWEAGEAHSLWLNYPVPPAAPSGDAVITITVTASNAGPWRFILTFPIVASSIHFVRDETTVADPSPTGDGDGIVEPGERVVVTLRLRNDGSEAASDGRVSLTVRDPHATVLAGEAMHAEWPAGTTRETDFVLDLGEGFTAPELSLFFQVSGSTWGPWHFSHVVPVLVPAPEFALENAWVFDPAPGGNRDGRAVPGERIRPRVRLRNIAAAGARNVDVTMAVDDPDVTVLRDLVAHDAWPAGEARNNDSLIFSISADATVSVTADDGGPWQFDVRFTIHEPSISFALASSWVFDPEPGGNRDGVATPGEQVLPRIRLRHVGIEDAREVEVTLSTDDPDTTIIRGRVSHSIWPAGAARNNDGFVISIAPDALLHDATLVARVSTSNGDASEFTVSLSVGAPRVEIVHRNSWLFDPEPDGNHDMRASPGEGVLPRVRLRNDGPSTALNVRVSLEFDDAAVMVDQGEVTQARWEPGAAITHSGFAIRITPDATPHEVIGIVTVSAGNGGPWQFPFVFPIVYRPAEFVARSSWVFDPAPGGDRDGQAEAGERVLPRLRLLHVGSEEARNARVSLTTDDADVTIVQAEAAHEAWAPGEARNSGFVVDVAPDAAVHDVTLRATVLADNGGPWDMSFTLPITGPAIAFAYQGLTRASVEAGGSRALGIRLRHVGGEPLEAVRITLASTDPDVSVGTAQVTHSTWLPGETRDSGDVTVSAATDALPRAVSLVVSVTTEQGGLWQFEVPITIERTTVYRMWGSSVSDPAPGGNSDGTANRGETVVPDVRIENHSLESFDVVATLTTDDPDLTIVDGVDTRSTWPGLPRRSRFQNLSDFQILIADDAVAHEATVTVTIAASHGDPRSHTFSFDISAALAKPPAFALRNSWAWDPQPGGNHDGQANPGERVFPRVRIASTGGPATGVQAVLSIIDDDITVVNGIVTHEAWPSGEARNNNGFVLDISETATPHDVEAVLSVTADNGGPWQFAVTIPIVAQEVVAETALLANYPNPFNPETWIPFD
ncbi:hypothetical protein HOI71_24105, partial [Candidatus Poribacteria bacterium]|nr:hypothetical protein [Candidatus Poribacteria bacterium]